MSIAAAIKGLPALAILAWLCAGAPSHAGTCRIYSDGQYTVQSCENDSYTFTDRHGRKRVYEPNAGFNRYPGQPAGPVFPRDKE